MAAFFALSVWATATTLPGGFQVPGPMENFGPPPGPPPPYMNNSYPGGPPPFDNSWVPSYQPTPRFDHPPPMGGDRFNLPLRRNWQSHTNDYQTAFHSRSSPSPNTQDQTLKTKTENISSAKTEDQRWLDNWLGERNIMKSQGKQQRKASSVLFVNN